MSAIAGLRAATSSSHRRLEQRLDVKARFTEATAYRHHLERMWGFCATLERQLDSIAFANTLADYESRRKLPLLTRDLVDLGVAPESVSRLPCCPALPIGADPAAAFGCVYVLEGATLGGRTLLPLVEDKLGLSAKRGAAFLASYGEHVTAMWQSFSASLDQWCASAERRALSAAAAVATFDALEQWLVDSPA
jgi:heme oxygenase (biliverdin-IX-beta and delta-forming)